MKNMERELKTFRNKGQKSEETEVKVYKDTNKGFRLVGTVVSIMLPVVIILLLSFNVDEADTYKARAEELAMLPKLGVIVKEPDDTMIFANEKNENMLMTSEVQFSSEEFFSAAAERVKVSNQSDNLKKSDADKNKESVKKKNSDKNSNPEKKSETKKEKSADKKNTSSKKQSASASNAADDKSSTAKNKEIQKNAPKGLSYSFNKKMVKKLSKDEHNVLCRIVEAEAGDQDVYGKILVANVVLNRVNSSEWPNSVSDVVFQKIGGATQFSPTKDGSYYRVKVKSTTVEAVDRALSGEDYSEKAIYFFQRNISSASSTRWFDNHLKFIVKYGCHEFFKDK